MEEETKMKEETKNVIIGVSIGAACLGILGMGYCAYQMHAVRSLVNGAADHIAGLTHVDIDGRMVDELVRKAVDEQSGNAVRNVANKVGNEMMSDIRNRVKQAVGNQTSEISKKVARQIADEISETDKDDIVDAVVKAATEKLVEKLSDEIDDEVGRVGKITKGIIAALQ